MRSTVMSNQGQGNDGSWIQELDGWRALSILLVLAGHLLPIGPKALQLNGAVATAGMGLFFILSGFLITTFLLHRPEPRPFLIRRGARILPLAWGFMLVVMVVHGNISLDGAVRHVLFLANLPPFGLTATTAHLWSLCMEVQFYLAAAILVGVLGRGGLLLLPLLAVSVTGLRIATGTHISIVTWLRVDEILAGACLALLYHAGLLRREGRGFSPLLLAPLALLYLAAAHPAGGNLNYARPYVAAALVGASLCMRGTIRELLASRPLRHVAAISYALYVWHPLLAESWLGTGEGVEKYLKRPLLFAALWGLAYVSTTYYEALWIRLGTRLARRGAASPDSSASPRGVGL